MTIRRLILSGMLVLAGLPALAGPRQAGQPVAAVYELFTSQGCSSCPPADMLFQSLAKEPGVLALSMPVTIWDYLGWKDTLALIAFTERQRGYAALRGDRQVYTPQAIINGVRHAVGSDRRGIETARTESILQLGVLALTPKLFNEAGRWRVRIGDSPLGRPAPPEQAQGGASERRSAHAGDVFIVQYERERIVPIGRGENSGRTVKYANVVRAITRIGQYTGAGATFDLPAGAQSTATEGFAVLIQAGTDRAPGAIIGAVDAPRE